MTQQLNKFFDTAIGKSFQTLLWTAAAYALVVIGAKVANVQWSDQMLALGAPGIVNWILYTAKVVIDKEVPNMPNSQPMMLVPKTNTATTTTVVSPTVQVTDANAAENLAKAVQDTEATITQEVVGAVPTVAPQSETTPAAETPQAPIS